jgi:hypothetical protein
MSIVHGVVLTIMQQQQQQQLSASVHQHTHLQGQNTWDGGARQQRCACLRQLQQATAAERIASASDTGSCSLAALGCQALRYVLLPDYRQGSVAQELQRFNLLLLLLL